MEESLMIYGISMVIALLVLYFIIKAAVTAGIREYNSELNAGTTAEVKITRLLAEIAGLKGVPEERVKNILSDKGKLATEKEILTGNIKK